MVYSEQQSNVLTWIPRFTAPLSIIGSSCILYLILCRMQSKLSTSYNRLMFVLSMFDITTSFGIALGSLPAPEPIGRGNQATCTAQGFVVQFGMLANLSYAISVMLYFSLTIVDGVSPQRFAKRYEPWMQATAFLTPLALAIVLIPLELYNWSGGAFCGISSSPPGCEAIPEVQCLRGGDIVVPILWGCLLVPAMVGLVVFYASVIRVYWKVRQTSQKVQGRSLTNVTAKMERLVATQCILYGLAFANTFVWNQIVGITWALGRIDLMQDMYPIFVLGNIFFPMQGFFNCCIFVRPRYLRIREANPTKRRLWAVRMMVFAKQEEFSRTVSRQTTRCLSTAGQNGGVTSSENLPGDGGDAEAGDSAANQP